LQAAYDDPNIKGILFEVNTGGGEVTAGQMVAASVQSRNKPLLTFAHMAASGGIMATMHSDEVMASSQMAQFGSVGVMYTIPTWMYRYYSGYYKDLYSTLSHNKNRGGREFERDGSVQAWIDELDELAQAFQEEVKNARPLRGDVSHTLSGEMFRANEAKDRGLIDSIGTYQQAFNRLATLARTDRI
ncbi:MAG: S49 family peptidase, partial [Bacteroidota bacterium]